CPARRKRARTPASRISSSACSVRRDAQRVGIRARPQTSFGGSSRRTTQYLVDHRSRMTQIISRVAQRRELVTAQMRADLRMNRKNIEQWSLLAYCLATKLIDEVVGILSPDIRAETHHDRLGHDQTSRHVDVVAHLPRIHLQPAQQEARLLEGAPEQTE